MSKPSKTKRDNTVEHKTTECKHCGHMYIKPCQTPAESKKCSSRRVK